MSLESKVLQTLQYHLEYCPSDIKDWDSYNNVAYRALRAHIRAFIRGLEVDEEAKAIIIASLLDDDTMLNYVGDYEL